MGVGDDGLEIESSPPLADEGLRALYEYWRVLGLQSGGLPPLTAFDPLCLPRVLPNIWVIEAEPESGRLRMRLAGECINAIYRRSIGRKFFAEVF